MQQNLVLYYWLSFWSTGNGTDMGQSPHGILDLLGPNFEVAVQ